MFKAIIIDDEYLFRQTLRTTFPWDKFNITICGEATNGSDALSLLKETQPDIALLDINMPTMNGLQFIKNAKPICPATQFIIISGYDSFSYAQEAISLGVRKYLLKPLQYKELAETIESILAQISLSYFEQKKYLTLNEQHNYYLPELRRQFLVKLLSPTVPSLNMIDEECAYLELPWNKCKYFWIVVAMAIDSKVNQPMFQDSSATRDLLSMVDRGLNLPYNAVACVSKTGHLTFLFASPELISFDKLQYEAKRIRMLLSTAAKYSFSFGVSNLVQSLLDLPKAYTQAYDTVRHNRFNSTAAVYFPKNIDMQQSTFVSQQQSIQLIAHMRSKNIQSVYSILQDLAQSITKQGYSKEILSGIYIDVLYSFLKVVEENTLDTLAEAILLELNNLSHFDSANDMVNCLKKWCNDIISTLNAKQYCLKAPGVDKAITYIDKHYSDPELTIESISKALFLNYAYLCSIFKRDMGITINQYIKQYRLQKALQLMDAGCTNITEIALAVGFPNANYFGKCFKKELNITPSEYLRTAKNDSTD